MKVFRFGCFFLAEAHVKDFEFIRSLTHFRYCSFNFGYSRVFVCRLRERGKKPYQTKSIDGIRLQQIHCEAFFAWVFSLCMCVYPKARGKEWRRKEWNGEKTDCLH